MDQTNRRWIFWLALALVAWALFLGIGAALGGGKLNFDLRRGLMVLGCMLLFLSFWFVLLKTRQP